MGMGCENRIKFCALAVVFAAVIHGSGAEGLKNGTMPNNVTFSTFSEGRNGSSSNATTVEVSKQNGSGRGGGGGGYRWGWGWGWGGGGGGGGGGWWKWGCGGQPKSSGGRIRGRKRINNGEDYKIGEFGQCVVRGRCRGMRLDCPLHCGGPCFYDCRNMCKAHCRRP